MIANKITIIPAKLLEIDDNGDYHLLCYLGFDNVQERVFNKELIKEKSDYYYISTKLGEGTLRIDIQSADEYEYIIKENYE